MNKSNGVALIAAGLAAGVGLSSILSSGLVPQSRQVSGQVMEAQTVASPIAVEQTRLTQQNFDALPMGATLAQVELVLGKGKLSAQSQNGDYKGETFSWSDSGAIVTLGFGNGKLTNKNAMGLKQAVAQLQPATTLVSAPAPSAVPSAPAVPQPVAFESLPPCDQLDSLARAGKSISEFLVSAHRVNDLSKYKSAIASTCPWNNEQLQVANRVINPPVVVVPRVVRQSSGGSSGGSTVVIREPAAPRWNNCNGIQEPGESYSARCEAAQRENDWTLKNNFMKPLDPIDKRPPGSGRPPNGYSGSN